MALLIPTVSAVIAENLDFVDIPGRVRQSEFTLVFTGPRETVGDFCDKGFESSLDV
jgi:hypothetical protein